MGWSNPPIRWSEFEKKLSDASRPSTAPAGAVLGRLASDSFFSNSDQRIGGLLQPISRTVLLRPSRWR